MLGCSILRQIGIGLLNKSWLRESALACGHLLMGKEQAGRTPPVLKTQRHSVLMRRQSRWFETKAWSSQREVKLILVLKERKEMLNSFMLTEKI